MKKTLFKHLGKVDGNTPFFYAPSYKKGLLLQSSPTHADSRRQTRRHSQTLADQGHSLGTQQVWPPMNHELDSCRGVKRIILGDFRDSPFNPVFLFYFILFYSIYFPFGNLKLSL